MAVSVHVSLPRLGQKLTQKIEKVRDVLFGRCRLRTLYLTCFKVSAKEQSLASLLVAFMLF